MRTKRAFGKQEKIITVNSVLFSTNPSILYERRLVKFYEDMTIF